MDEKSDARVARGVLPDEHATVMSLPNFVEPETNNINMRVIMRMVAGGDKWLMDHETREKRKETHGLTNM